MGQYLSSVWHDDEYEVDFSSEEAQRQMGGFWILEVADREAAQEWGRRAARASEGPVEARPLQGTRP
jgi:hypothetical protein